LVDCHPLLPPIDLCKGSATPGGGGPLTQIRRWQKRGPKCGTQQSWTGRPDSRRANLFTFYFCFFGNRVNGSKKLQQFNWHRTDWRLCRVLRTLNRCQKTFAAKRLRAVHIYKTTIRPLPPTGPLGLVDLKDAKYGHLWPRGNVARIPSKRPSLYTVCWLEAIPTTR